MHWIDSLPLVLGGCCWLAAWAFVVLELDELRERVNDESENLSACVVRGRIGYVCWA